ncbi:Crp/Fnr family transcriptional regulator [Nitrospirillum pindoramense]|nr:Crp/Fnr family transcriptional regulator [Nitrospirillum amazonense]
MPPPTELHCVRLTTLNKSATREARGLYFQSCPLLAGSSRETLADLVSASDLVVCQPGQLVFAQGQTAGPLVFVVSGIIQRRAVPAGHEGQAMTALGGGILPLDEEAPWLHLGLHSARPLESGIPNELVCDTDLIPLATAAAIVPRHGASALAVGDTVVAAITREAFAQCLEREPAVRDRLARVITEQFRRAQGLAEDLVVLKDESHVRLARLLLDLFDAAAEPLNPMGKASLPKGVLQQHLATALGLSRKQVNDDLGFLKDFRALANGRASRLTLLDRGRLAMIAAFRPADDLDDGPTHDPADDRDNDAHIWFEELRETLIDKANLLWARQVAEKATRYHPQSRKIAHLQILAHLRDGALDAAERLLTRGRKFTMDDPVEDYAALTPRLLKDRSFQSANPEKSRFLALQSAAGYRSVHQRTGGYYTGINAAAMLVCAGRADDGRTLASEILRQLPEASGYWPLATRAEALGLLGQFDQAATALAEAINQPDAQPGTVASTFTQFCRLHSATQDEGWRTLMGVFKLPPIIALSAVPPGASWAASPELFSLVKSLKPSAVYMGGLGWGRDIDLAEQLLADGHTAVSAIIPEPPTAYETRTIRPGGGNWSKRFNACKGAINLMRLCPKGLDPEQPINWQRQTNRSALGLALAAARHQERPCFLVTGDETVQADRLSSPGESLRTECLPAWAAPDDLTAGFVALVRVIAEGDLDAIVTGLPGEGVTSRRQLGASIITCHPSVTGALDTAFQVLDRALWSGRRISICCDIGTEADWHAPEAFLASRIMTQKAPPPGDIKATAFFLAELVLLNRPDLSFNPSGQYPSDNKPSHPQLWTIRRQTAA